MIMLFVIKTLSGEIYLWDSEKDPNYKTSYTKRPTDYIRNYAIYAKCISTNQYMNIMPHSIEGYIEIKDEEDVNKFIMK